MPANESGVSRGILVDGVRADELAKALEVALERAGDGSLGSSEMRWSVVRGGAEGATAAIVVRQVAGPVGAPTTWSGTAEGVAELYVDEDLEIHQQVARLLPALGVRQGVDVANELFVRRFDAVLFDLDGTLVDSTSSVIRSWRRFAEHFAVPMEKLHENHGQPARVLIDLVLPSARGEEAYGRITELEVGDATGLHPVRGARELFESVPVARRAIVTSGSVAIASARLAAAGIARPDVWVTVEDVKRGKPHPDPFLIGAERLGFDPSRCLVVEDAAAGIAAARTAGCSVLAVAGTAPAEELEGAHLVVDGLDQVRIVQEPDSLRLLPADAPTVTAL